MFFVKKGVEGQNGDVQFVNGTVQFQRIRLNVYAYCVDGVLIDTGSSSLKDVFYPFLEKQSFDQVRITHIHEDHTGNAAYIEKQWHVPIYLHEKGIAFAHQDGQYPMYRKLFWGKRESFHPQPMPETFSSRQYNWQVIETPGHATDHVAFLNTSTGQLFTGDLYVQTKQKLCLREEDTPTTMRSLEHLLTYDFDEVFCNHAGHLVDGRERLQAKLDYLREMEYRVGRLYEEGYNSKHINEALFPKKYPIVKMSFGEWDSLHIVESFIDELK